MPYISMKQREMFDALHDELLQLPSLTAGDLNYLITTICDQHIRNKQRAGYADINEVIGVLECAKLEFYRRIAGPYEDQKMREHGDVYTVKP